MRRKTTPLHVRFWQHVDKSAPNGCWLWTASISPNGYGKIGSGEYSLLIAHRLSWEMANGPIPEGLWVLHNCPGGDNRRCVNPAHLWLGTPADNNADTKRKGRWPTGERAGGAKLTESLVVEIRERYARGAISQYRLAAEYGVTQMTVNKIVRRRMWKHVL